MLRTSPPTSQSIFLRFKEINLIVERNFFSSLHDASSYKPVDTYATVPEGNAEVVDFKLTRIRSEPSSPAVPPDSSEVEFQSFIRQLSLEPDQLIQNTAPTSSFRYRGYMELSEFLRSLNLNFPKITSLRRYWSITSTPIS